MREIISGSTAALIDPKGGYVASLKNEKGYILFPRKIYTDVNGSHKVRGGSHVCMPNFGPSLHSDLPQHGYGRISNWRSVLESPDEALLVLDTGGAGPYKNVRTELHYEITENSFEMVLIAFNYGKTVARFAPGFHPYFALGSDRTARLDGKLLALDKLSDTKFFDGPKHVIETNGQKFTIESSELQRWAVWTDQLGGYVCVEPTLDGYAFLEPPTDDQIIRGGVSRIYSCTISW